ncbi:MAG: 4-alpha-glucanotransferase, partial [Actinomycetota bacterium]
AHEVEGQSGVCLEISFPDRIPAGYHTLAVRNGKTEETAHIFSAPSAVSRRFSNQWGVFVPLYSLVSKDTWGCGDFGSLDALSQTVESYGSSVVATLPVFAGFPDESSPYRPVSRLFWEERYLEIEALPEFTRCRAARDLVRSAGFKRQLESMRRADLIDYPGVSSLKRSVLELLANEFYSGAGVRDEGFRRFLKDKPEAKRYASFRAKRERGYQPGGPSPAVTADRYHLYVQWAAHEQLAQLGERLEERGSQLLFDLPLGVHPDGFDVNSDPSAFMTGLSVGAPGDQFFPHGQKWGMPPWNPEALRRSGHRQWRRCLQTILGPAGALRIDHIMGFHRLFLIPEEATASSGIYLEYPADEFYAAALIEANRCNAVLIGEDLGTVEPAVRSRMRRRNIYGTYVMQFEFSEDPSRPFRSPGRHQCAAIDTHDTATFAAFLSGHDIEERQEMGLMDHVQAAQAKRHLKQVRSALVSYLRGRGFRASEKRPVSVLEGCLSELGAGEAGLVLANLEDLWGETRRQNFPGTGPGRPNWRRKVAYPLEGLKDRPDVGRILNKLDRARKDPGHGKK